MKETFNPTVREAHQWASIFLEDQQFKEGSAQTYLLWLLDWDLNQWVRGQDYRLTGKEWEKIQESFEKIVQHVPIQYIVGYQEFMGHRFKVTQDTLIPREETAGIIDLLMKARPENYHQLQVLDIGTGTGILPIMVKKLRPNFKVTGSDISQQALKVAKKNAEIHQVEIDWILSDVFDDISQSFDVILSNPPYIGMDEGDLMDKSVKLYEPALALYADHDGLAIYEKLANQVLSHLEKDGLIIMEIGFKQGLAVQQLFKEKIANGKITIEKDYYGHDRYIVVDLREG